MSIKSNSSTLRWGQRVFLQDDNRNPASARRSPWNQNYLRHVHLPPQPSNPVPFFKPFKGGRKLYIRSDISSTSDQPAASFFGKFRVISASNAKQSGQAQPPSFNILSSCTEIIYLEATAADKSCGQLFRKLLVKQWVQRRGWN